MCKQAQIRNSETWMEAVLKITQCLDSGPSDRKIWCNFVTRGSRHITIISNTVQKVWPQMLIPICTIVSLHIHNLLTTLKYASLSLTGITNDSHSWKGRISSDSHPIPQVFWCGFVFQFTPTHTKAVRAPKAMSHHHNQSVC